MSKRDYINPTPKKTNTNSILIIGVVIAILFSIIAFFWVLKEKAPINEKTVPTVIKEETKEISVLPTRPEERYSYIHELETREIPVDESEYNLDKIAKLNEQQQELLKQQERNLSKQQEQQNIPLPTEETKKYTVIEHNVTNIEKPKEKASVEISKPVIAEKGKFGLKCGAFKNKSGADNMHARLTMNGFNSYVSVHGKWNRVIVGPVNSKKEAQQLEQKIKKIADCYVVGM